jgi:hypothetical protein
VREALRFLIGIKLGNAFRATTQIDVVVEVGRGIHIVEQLDKVGIPKRMPDTIGVEPFKGRDNVGGVVRIDPVPNPGVCLGR